DTVRGSLCEPERRSNNRSMARRATVRRLEGQRGNREGRRRTLLPTTVHARTSPDRRRGLIGASRLLGTFTGFFSLVTGIPLPASPNRFHEGSLTFLGQTVCFVHV